MKLLLLVFVGAALAAIIHAVPFEPEASTAYQRFVEMAGDDGVVHHVDLEEQPDVALLSQVARNPANNMYLLYTRRNRNQPREIVHLDTSTIWNSGYEAWKPTVVIVHGWLGNQNSGLNALLVDAFLNRADVNVIVMDWRRLATSGYVTAATGVPAVGRGLGQFLDWLHLNTGAPYYTFHLVGFSLGAHLVGNAGRFLRSRIARITGLDPAGPLWHYSSNRLSASDGVYVEAIHTDGGVTGYGIGSNLGNVDFHLNGGNSQPGCITNICDHNRAWEVFAASITHNHLIGNECLSNLQMTLNRCSGPLLPLGNDDLYKRGSGTFRVNTARRYPF